MRVAIIGAGISGLALAYYLQKLGVPYDLFEAGTQVGGNIRTLQVNDYLLELGPNALQNSPELEELIKELKLEEEVLPVAPYSNSHYIFRDGSWHKLPSSATEFLTSSFFSSETRLRMLNEKHIPPAEIAYETITGFFERRFGRDVVDAVVKPLVNSMYGGDPDKLLIEKALPGIKELETKYGSVLKGLLEQKNTLSQQVQLFSFIKGMNELPQAIAQKLVSLHLEHRVDIVTRCQGKFIVCCSSNSDHDTEEYDVLVLALPAHQAADLLHYTYPGLAAALLNVNYASMAVVHTVYNRQDVRHHLNGFGAMYAQAETPFASNSIWNSSAFEGRCQPHEALFTTYVSSGKYQHQGLLDRTKVMQQVHQELCRTYGISSKKPTFQHLHLWHYAIPQYDLYIEDAHLMAKELEQDKVFVAANWQAGVSVSSCIRYAKELALKINLLSPLISNS